MPHPLISIIVPVYKVEPYLRRCLDSIVNQTYSNLEIILVNDGSPDGCPQICDEYAALDNRIIVIHKENGGLSDARNAGLDICKGEYISFVDSDDWVEQSYIETLLHILEDSKADISIGNFTKSQSSYTYILKDFDRNYSILEPSQAIKNLWDKNLDATFVTAWGKLFKRELYNNVRFPKGRIHEDEYTSYKLFYNSNRVVFLDAPLYVYFQREDSIMGMLKECSIRAQIEKYLFFKRKKEFEIIDLFIKQLCWDVIFAYSQVKLHREISNYKKGKEKELLCIYRHIMNDCSKRSSSLERKIYTFFRLFPQFYVLYQKFSPIKIRSK